MDPNILYQSSLKMLNDKYKLSEFPKETFMEIYMNIYNEHKTTTPNNDLNKLVLIEIRNKIERDLKERDLKEKENEDLELKIKEAEAIRASIAKMTPIIPEETHTTSIIPPQQTINVSNYQQTMMTPKCKTFIVNTTKNNFKIKSMIDIKSHSIYPCYICIPADIKYKTPYLILSINDGIKQINYTYIPETNYHHQCNWDNWKLITDNYLDISLGSNQWTINFIDYLGNPFDMNEYQTIVNDVLMVNNNYTLSIDKPQFFNKNDKIKIIKNNGYISDNNIINIDNNVITIHKNNLELDDFIDSKIINYKHNFSITFTYYIK